MSASRSGKIVVQIVGGKGITGSDGNTEPDCYVKFQWEGAKYKTRICGRCGEPQWNECFEFYRDASKSESQILRLEVIQNFLLSRNRPLGRVDIGLNGLRPHLKSDGWYPLQSGKGLLRLQLTFYPSSDKPSSSYDTPVLSAGEAKKHETCPSSLVFQLKTALPQCSETEISNALKAAENDVDKARNFLLSELIRNAASGGQPTSGGEFRVSPLAPPRPQEAVVESPVIKVYADDSSDDLQENTSDVEDLGPEKMAQIQDLIPLLPHIPPKRIYKTLVQYNFDKEKTVDALLDNLVATIAMSHQAQTLCQSGLLQAQQLHHQQVNQSFQIFSSHNAPPGPINPRPSPVLGLQPAVNVSHVPNAAVDESGRRKALLIGVNYIGSRRELKGCIQDVSRIKKLITGVYGFPDDPNLLTILTDDHPDRRLHPTRSNILLAMNWLVQGVQPGDVLFFHFSGHGSQKLDMTGTEENGYDETILPVDYTTSGHILDDEINERLVQPLPSGVKLVAVMDCCHSGTGMDLPYILDQQKRAWRVERNPKFSYGDVVMFSGCADDETSADLMIPNWGAGGAMSLALIASMTSNPFNSSYSALMASVEKAMRARGFKQRPQLSSAQKFSIKDTFSFTRIIPNMNDYIGREYRRDKKKFVAPKPPKRVDKKRHRRKKGERQRKVSSSSSSSTESNFVCLT